MLLAKTAKISDLAVVRDSRCDVFHCLYTIQVAKHLAKLFDSMASLKFEEDASGEPTKNAVGMYSKDKEYVDFDEPFQCVGQVSVGAC